MDKVCIFFNRKFFARLAIL